MTLNGIITWTNGMDALSRIVLKNISNGTKTYSTSYTYLDVASVANKTTTQLKTIKNGAGDTIGTTLNKTTTYTYGNTNWKDQLTSYNGKAITYDGIGNPLTYDGNTYSWQNGRQLSGITNTGKSQTITYKYNNSGIRTEKTVNGVKTNYYLDGSKVIYEKTGNNIIYDENGMITALKNNILFKYN